MSHSPGQLAHFISSHDELLVTKVEERGYLHTYPLDKSIF